MNSAKTFRDSLRSPSAPLGVLACCLGFGILGCSTQVIERLPPDHLQSPPDVSVAVNPASATAGLGGTVHFAATVTGPPGASTTVNWSVDESAAGGTIGTDGTYTAPLTPGTFHVTAIAQANGANSARATVTVTASAPTIASFSPPSGYVGALVNLTGTNFIGVTSVKFNGASGPVSALIGVVTTTTIQTQVPPNATSGHITVTAIGGTATSAENFIVTTSVGGSEAPTIATVTPPTASPGQPVDIAGTYFSSPLTVKFNGTVATVSYFTETQILTSVPLGATSGPLTVTTSKGTATYPSFTVVPPAPTLSGFSPDHGLPGDPITLTGTDLLTTRSVKFGGAEASFQVSDNEHVVAMVPSDAPTGLVTISLQTLGGALTTSGFTVD